jgi:hypothetical protein
MGNQDPIPGTGGEFSFAIMSKLAQGPLSFVEWVLGEIL